VKPGGIEKKMGVEIERKFLVADETWRVSAGPGRRFCQGHIARSEGASVRVRRADQHAFVTIKGERHGIARPEFEYEIPVDEAEEMLRTLCVKPLLEKTRYCVNHGGLTWEIDEFQGDAEGLFVAEVELERVDQPVLLPAWVGAEVSTDPRYRSANIAAYGPPVARGRST
jgi:CYTH domain-containing protein